MLKIAAMSATMALVPVVPVQAAKLEVGQPAPPLVLTTLDGHKIATRDLLGKVVIVTFWATWCGPCHEELPVLSDYAQRHAQQGLQVLAFSLDSPDALPEVRTFASTGEGAGGVAVLSTDPVTGLGR